MPSGASREERRFERRARHRRRIRILLFLVKGHEDGLVLMFVRPTAPLPEDKPQALGARTARSVHEGCKHPWSRTFPRKEVIQPQVPLRLPCYDFTPVAEPTVVGCLLLRG